MEAGPACTKEFPTSVEDSLLDPNFSNFTYHGRFSTGRTL